MKIIRYVLVFLILLTSLFSSELVPTKDEVAKLYVATFNRAPDSAGLNYWVNDSGLTLSQIAQSFFDQSETQTLYPPTVSNRDFIKAVYENLFNREPDSAGWDYWENQLNIGAFSKNRFIEAVINGAQDTDISKDATILENKNSVGLAFADSGIDDIDEAKIVMDGVTADENTVTFIKSKIESNDITEGDWTNYYIDLLAGKTFYTVDKDGYTQIEEVIFNQDASSFQIIKSDSTEDLNASINGDKFNCSCDTRGGYSLISQVNGYIYLDYRLADGSKDGDGIRLYNTQEEAQTYLNSLTDMNDSGFTAEMINNKSYFYVFVNDSDSEFYGILKRDFKDGIMTTSDVYGNKFSDTNITLENGKLSYDSGDYSVEYELISKESDYLNVKSTEYNLSHQAIEHFSSRLYYDEAKAAQYQKTLETYDNTFFNTNTTFVKPEAIEQINFAKLDSNHIIWKTRFYNYGFTQNSYSIDTTGITLRAEPISGEKSQIKGYLIDKPYHYKGIAVNVDTTNLDEDRRNRVKIQMNGYNDGTQDIEDAIVILKDKIVYYQWQSETADDEQTLANWTTVLDGMDFSNKSIKLAVWIKDAKVHFYAECDGQIGYETFDISGYEDNPLEGSHWSHFKVEAKDGATISTTAKFTKIDVLR